jgi:hypothetical protein
MVPEVTVSPSFTSHLASVPSSMVGERAGIFSSIGISRSRPARRCRVRKPGALASVQKNPQLR